MYTDEAGHVCPCQSHSLMQFSCQTNKIFDHKVSDCLIVVSLTLPSNPSLPHRSRCMLCWYLGLSDKMAFVFTVKARS